MLGGNPLGGHIGSRSAELLDGRMTAEDEHRFRLHIGRCQACAALLAAHQDVRRTLRASAMPDHLTPSDSLLSGLLALGAPAPEPDSVVRDLLDTPLLDGSRIDAQTDLGEELGAAARSRRVRGRLADW